MKYIKIEHECKYWLAGFKYAKSHAHCLYRFLDGEKIPASNLVFQAFKGFIGTKNKTKKSIFARAFLRKSTFCTFSAKILDLTDPGACYGYFFLLTYS